MSQPIRRVLCPRAVALARVAAIHLRRTLPHASSGLPGSSGGPPSNAPCLALLRVGFAEPRRSPGALVVSCTTVSPLPVPRGGPAVCSLWHCPAGHPGWVLPTTLPCGARTFLGGCKHPTRPPGWLIRVAQGSGSGALPGTGGGHAGQRDTWDVRPGVRTPTSPQVSASQIRDGPG